MYAFELYEQNQPKIVVTYPGRFQPFHQGHAGVFAQLQKKFGSENVYILTSNDQSSLKSPFNFSDKYQLITAAGVPGDRVIQTTGMYSVPEGVDPSNTIFITAVGAPDADRLRPDSFLKKDKKDSEGNIIKAAGSPSYYKTWSETTPPVTADQHGYVIVIPEIKKSIKINGQNFDVSHGTDARNLWNQIRGDESARKEFLTQMYKKPSTELGNIFDKIPQPVKEDAAGVGVIASKKQAKDPRYSNSLTKDVQPGALTQNLRAFRLVEQSDNNNKIIELFSNFLPIAAKILELTQFPKIKLVLELDAVNGQASFGGFSNKENCIYLAMNGRHPVDILRTLAHELVHFKQHTKNMLDSSSGDTGSDEENQANAVAGIIMRLFNKAYPDAVSVGPFALNE